MLSFVADLLYIRLKSNVGGAFWQTLLVGLLLHNVSDNNICKTISTAVPS